MSDVVTPRPQQPTEASGCSLESEGDRRAAAFATAVLLLLLGALYFAFENRSFYFDSISYAKQVEEGALVHPHHLLHNVLGWIAYRVAGRPAGVRAIYVLQWVNSVGALVGLWFFQRLARRYAGSRGVALWATLLLGVSHAWWKYATAGETYIWPVTFILCGLWLCEHYRERLAHRWTPLVALLPALPLAAAPLLHQTHALFVCALPVWLIGRRCRWSNALTLLSGVGLIVFAAYMLGYVAEKGSWDVPGMVAWSLSYARHPDFAGAYGLRIGWWNVPAAAAAWANLITAERWPLALRFVFLEGLLLGSIGYGLVRRRAFAGDGAWRGAFLATWVAVYAVFGFWWEPRNTEFLVGVLPPLLLADAIAVSPIVRARSPSRLWPLAGIVVIVFSFGVNFYQQIWRLHAAQGYQKTERLLLEVVEPDDIVVTPGTLSNYLPYFHGRALTSIRGVQWGVRYGVGSAGDYLERLAHEIDEHLAAGRTVYTVDYPFELGTPTQRAVAVRPVSVRELTQADIRDFYSRYEVSVVRHRLGKIARLSR